MPFTGPGCRQHSPPLSLGPRPLPFLPPTETDCRRCFDGRCSSPLGLILALESPQSPPLMCSSEPPYLSQGPGVVSIAHLSLWALGRSPSSPQPRPIANEREFHIIVASFHLSSTMTWYVLVSSTSRSRRARPSWQWRGGLLLCVKKQNEPRVLLTWCFLSQVQTLNEYFL